MNNFTVGFKGLLSFLLEHCGALRVVPIGAIVCARDNNTCQSPDFQGPVHKCWVTRELHTLSPSQHFFGSKYPVKFKVFRSYSRNKSNICWILWSKRRLEFTNEPDGWNSTLAQLWWLSEPRVRGLVDFAFVIVPFPVQTLRFQQVFES